MKLISAICVIISGLQLNSVWLCLAGVFLTGGLLRELFNRPERKTDQAEPAVPPRWR